MMNAIKESPTIGQDAVWGATIIKMMDQMVPTKEIDVKASTTYKPEYSWNYEVGSHLTLWAVSYTHLETSCLITVPTPSGLNVFFIIIGIFL